jgi:hypothetical protein
MYENRTMKRFEIGLRRGGERMRGRVNLVGVHCKACVDIPQWNSLVQLIYINKNTEKRL